MQTVSVNLLAVLVAAVVNMIIGAVWYSSALFAGPWQKLTGKSAADMKSAGATKGYVLTFVGALLLSYILAYVLQLTATTTIMEALKMGFWLWLGFTAATSLSDYVFSGRPMKLYWINNGYQLVSILVMSVILVSWMA